MPLIAKGSAFSYLQSIAMGGGGSMAGLQSIIGLFECWIYSGFVFT